MITTTMGMLNGVHSNTSHLGPVLSLVLEFEFRGTSLKEWLVSSSAASDHTDHGSAATSNSLSLSRGETDSGFGTIITVLFIFVVVVLLAVVIRIVANMGSMWELECFYFFLGIVTFIKICHGFVASIFQARQIIPSRGFNFGLIRSEIRVLGPFHATKPRFPQRFRRRLVVFVGCAFDMFRHAAIF